MDKYVKAAENNKGLHLLVLGKTNDEGLLVIDHPELDVEVLKNHPDFKKGPRNSYLIRLVH